MEVNEPKDCSCKRCGYEWTARAKKPKACPRCKSYAWDKPVLNDKGADEF